MSTDEFSWLDTIRSLGGLFDDSLVETILESISDAVFVIEHPSREIVFCNSAACEMFGYTRSELIGKQTRRLHVDEESYREFGDKLPEALEEGALHNESRLRRADGSTFAVEHTVDAIDDPDASPRRLVSVVRDISRRVQARNELRKSKEKFAAAFQVNPHSATIVTLEDLRFLEVNEGFTDISGYSADEIIGRRVTDFDFWVDPTVQQRILEQLKAGESVQNVETQFRSADGEIIDALYSATPLELDGETCVLAITQDISRRKEYERQLAYRALHDTLTGLPNRNLFCDRLEHALERTAELDEEIAVVCLDLDRFKVVNDTLGHSAGDQLLKTVAQRLRETVRNEVTIARFDGDEFALMIERIEELDEARKVARQVVESVEQPCCIQGTDFHPAISVGVAVSNDETRDADDLLRYADV
ncbi:MAG: diguanylate cyclase domain-containing protein, partial [Bradymonadaceae bacterium]